MAIKGIVFDIGGVLEITPDLGTNTKWTEKLHLEPDALRQLSPVWRAGSIGEITEAEVHQQIGEIMAWDEAQVNGYMDDMWREYLGTLNVELAEYFRNLRPQYQTAILSNSFVGAREREAAHYQFDTICDFIIYSHEVGLQKPDPKIYELTCKRLGLTPAEVIFVDNYQDLLDAAQAVGMHSVLFQTNKQTIADIQACIAANLNVKQP